VSNSTLVRNRVARLMRETVCSRNSRHLEPSSPVSAAGSPRPTGQPPITARWAFTGSSVSSTSSRACAGSTSGRTTARRSLRAPRRSPAGGTRRTPSPGQIRTGRTASAWSPGWLPAAARAGGHGSLGFGGGIPRDLQSFNIVWADAGANTWVMRIPPEDVTVARLGRLIQGWSGRESDPGDRFG
jgi:hypothetical protein